MCLLVRLGVQAGGNLGWLEGWLGRTLFGRQMANRFPSLAPALAVLLAAGSALGGLGWLWWSSAQRGDVNFLPKRTPAEWIVYPSAADAVSHLRLETSTAFRRPFALEQAPAAAVLSVAGFHRYTVSINGIAPGAPIASGENWKAPDRFEVSKQLRAGENQITVTVFNTNGPPALWLSLDMPGSKLRSDESWEASYAGGAWRAARLATRPKIVPAGSPLCGGEEPWASLRAHWLTMLLLAALSAGGCWLMRRFGKGGERWLVVGLTGLWVALFANNLSVLPGSVGFDAGGHMEYIRYLEEHRTLPLAGEGYEMFQAPLYYVLCAVLLKVFSLSVSQASGLMALRIMGLGIGAAHFALVWASLRLLFPGERSKSRWGLALAAFLPPMLYLAQYVSNEALAAALVSACVYLTLRILKGEAVSWKSSAALGVCLGAALLAKSTALLAVPAILGALLWKAWLTPRSGQGSPRAEDSLPARDMLRAGLVLAMCVVVCGWHYARLWVHYGNPLIGVWDPRTGFSWWQDDGYRTSAFYLRFGAALCHPWFSAFKSFGDGIYATLWGDGLFGGAADLVSRPPWNYDLMSVGYWLALLPTLAVIVGAGAALVNFQRRPSAEWFLLLGLGFLAALAVLYLSVAAPYYCHIKAFYALPALIPFCACGAWGCEILRRRSGKLGCVLSVLFGVWAMDSYAAFWIVRSSVPALLARSRGLLEDGRYAESVQTLSRALRLEPENPIVHSQLAMSLEGQGRTANAIVEYSEALRLDPDLVGPLNNLAWIRAAHSQARFRDGAEAVRLAERACRVTEYKEPMLVGTLGAAYAEAGRFEDAVAAAAKARELALALGHWDVAEKNEKLGRLFAARQPYRETAGARDAGAP